MIAINLFHFFVVFPLLLLLCKRLSDYQQVMRIPGIPTEAIQVLAVVCVVGMLYHGKKIVDFVRVFGVSGLMDKQLLMM